MRLLSPHLLALVVGTVFDVASASSRPRNPLRSISTVHNASIHTHTGRVTAYSDFDLTFITRDDLHVRLQLQPNHDILASDATITYLNADGTILRTEGVDRLDHKVYKGTAWIRRPNVGHDQWQNVGWARTVMHVDGKHPMFEGSFSVHHDFHHIQSVTNYERNRHRSDPTVEMLDGFEDSPEPMVLWRDSDIRSNAELSGHVDLRRESEFGEVSSCASDQLTFNSNPDHPVFADMRRRAEQSSFAAMDLGSLFGKRQSDTTTGGNSAGVNLSSTIGQSSGCPSPRKVALVGVAADCNYMQTFNSSDAARSNIIAQMNSASAAWESAFNISLGLQNLTMSETACPATPAPATAWNQGCSDSVQIQDRLNLFSAWRGAQGGNNSHWTLLSTCNTGATIGLAWLGQACVNNALVVNSSSTGNGPTSGTQSETVSGANVVISTQGTNEWQIIAHETGHTFGAVHDCDTQTCADPTILNSQQCCPLSFGTCNADAKYIMNPYATEGATSFSACTVGNICSAIGRNSVNTACLTENKGVQTINGQTCGNGIVETGEECDCGGTAGCGDDKCCDPTTCKFTAGSVCDDANESCCNNCQLATNGTVCRASTGACDPAEVCSGASPNCPADSTTPDGTSCGSNGLQCTSGQCTSRDQQCKTVMGNYNQGNQTYACSDSGCGISCASPQFGPNVCYQLPQNFLDGTDCGGGGRCQNGQCQGTTVGGEVKSWINEHKGLVIGLAVAIGGLLLLLILGCCCSAWSGRRRQRRGVVPKNQNPSSSRRRRDGGAAAAANANAASPNGWQGWNASPAPGPKPETMSQQPPYAYYNGWYANASNHQDPGYGSSGRAQSPAWMSSAVPPPPMPPPPSATYGNRGGQSVRYA